MARPEFQDYSEHPDQVSAFSGGHDGAQPPIDEVVPSAEVVQQPYRSPIDGFASRRRIEAYPGPTVTEVPHLAAALPVLAAAHNGIRVKAGLEPLSFVPWSYKLVSTPDFTNDPYIQQLQAQYGSSGGTVGSQVSGFHSTDIGLTIVRFDADVYNHSLAGTVSQLRDFGHETAHAAVDGAGIAGYSFDLNEGRAEAANRGVLETHVLPQYLGPAEYASRDALSERRGMTSEGVQLTRKYVIMYDPTQRPAPARYTYIRQLKLWESMEAADPDAHHELDMAVVRGKPAKAKEIVGKAYGEDVAEALTVRRNDLLEISDIIRTRAKLPEDEVLK